MRSTFLRFVTGATGAFLTVALAVAAPAIAAPTTPPTADVSSAVDYLVAGLTDGHYYSPVDGHADFGLTMDGALALAATGSRDTALNAIVTFLDGGGRDAHGKSVDSYTGIGTGDASGGAIGKQALLAESTGYNPRDFGGHDLITALHKTVCTKTIPNVCAAPGNYRYATSTFSQSVAIIAQLRAGDSTGAAKPIAYLEGVQHGTGAFPSALPGTDSDVDSSAMAAMALALVPGADARQALARTLQWLAGRQNTNGSFPGSSGQSANSAGLAIQALRLDAQTYASQLAKAESFLASLQNADGGFAVAAGAPGSDVRASAQALSGAVGTPFGSVLDDLRAKATTVDGARYVISQLTDGDHYTSSFNGKTFPDQGGTADGLFALLAAGGHADTVKAMTTYLAGQVKDYADPTGATGGPYSGSLAKLALVAEATGGNPHSFGGADLLSVLTSKVCTAAIAGDYSPCTAKGDIYNAFSTVSQTLAVLALQASPVGADHLSVDSPIVVRLHQLQCPDGGFSSVLFAPGGTCTSDVDSTAYAVQALTAVAGTDTWLGAAQGYLEKAQSGSGLFPGAAGDNSNSTALAAQALQSLVDALTSPTADPPQPKTVTPIAAWQSALTGLRTLAVSGGGFGISSNKTADLRSTTQSVAAAAQVSLLQLSGATILSLPRIPTTTASGGGTSTAPGGGSSTAPGGGSSTAPPTSGSPTSGGATSVPSAGSSSSRPGTNGSGAAVGSSDGGIANTGVTTQTQLAWALALLLLGAALAFAGRRRIAIVIGRHRASTGPRHR